MFVDRRLPTLLTCGRLLRSLTPSSICYDVETLKSLQQHSERISETEIDTACYPLIKAASSTTIVLNCLKTIYSHCHSVNAMTLSPTAALIRSSEVIKQGAEAVSNYSELLRKASSHRPSIRKCTNAIYTPLRVLHPSQMDVKSPMRRQWNLFLSSSDSKSNIVIRHSMPL